MRQLATIQEIADVQPIENADAIEKVKVKEWWVVAKKGEFKIGDRCLFYEIDSFLPVKPEYEFLLKGSKPKKLLVDGVDREGIRLKTIKLRGQISQGLVLPINTFPLGDIEQMIGTDVSEYLDVVKYEQPIPACLSGKIKGNFPAYLPKTDEERIQNCSYLLEKYKGQPFFVTSKLDGTSATFYKKDGLFGVCSRNLDLLETEGNTYWQVARELNIENILPDNFAIQGEIVGDGIQQNPLRMTGRHFFVFNVYDIVKGQYLSFTDFTQFVKNLGLQTVPIISDNFILNHNIDEILGMATSPSPLNQDVLQEGIVVRPLVEREETINTARGRLSFKAISNEYLLKVEQ